MDNYIIGIILFFSTVLISIVLIGRARGKLTREKMLELANLNSINLRYLFGVIIAISLLASLANKFHWINTSISFYGIILILIAYAILSFVLSFRRLRKNDFPKSYINTYLLCTGLRVVGGVLLFIFAMP